MDLHVANGQSMEQEQVSTLGSLSFFAYGTPAPQGSKRYVGRGIMVESSKKVKPWREAVATFCRDAIQKHYWTGSKVDCALLEITFGFPRPAGHYGSGKNAGVVKASAPKYPSRGTADLDKLVRATCDAITTAGGWIDDRVVVGLRCSKVYTPAGAPLGARITIHHVDNTTLGQHYKNLTTVANKTTTKET